MGVDEAIHHMNFISGMCDAHQRATTEYVLSSVVIVTGEANFTMETTSLTVGGFSQPSVAWTLVEQAGSIETGLVAIP